MGAIRMRSIRGIAEVVYRMVFLLAKTFASPSSISVITKTIRSWTKVNLQRMSITHHSMQFMNITEKEHEEVQLRYVAKRSTKQNMYLYVLWPQKGGSGIAYHNIFFGSIKYHKLSKNSIKISHFGNITYQNFILPISKIHFINLIKFSYFFKYLD